MRNSLRYKLLGTFLVLVILVGAGTLFAIERTLADDLVHELDERMSSQAKAAAEWITTQRNRDAGRSPRADHLGRLAKKLAEVTGTRITIVDDKDRVQADSSDTGRIGHKIEPEAFEVWQARKTEIGRAIRELDDDEAPQYLVAKKTELGSVIRLAMPLDNVLTTRAKMRNRLLVGSAFGFLGCLFLSWIFVRAITRPLQAMTVTAERLAKGEYDAPAPQRAVDSGGELGVLARAMMRMAGEVKARVHDLTQQRDLLEVVFGGLVEGVLVVDRTGKTVLVNDAAKPLLEASRSSGKIDPVGLPEVLRPLVDRALAGEACDEELELAGRNVRCNARPLGEPGAIVVLYDVTRMRALENVRREFLSNAAHELRTPITSISGYSETLINSNLDSETSKEFLQTIHRNAERISSLVNNLVLLDTLGGRAEAVGERVSISLGEVLNDAARTTRGIKPSAQIEVVPTDLAVLGTRDGLDHVFQNLIDNAVKYGDNTKVTVTVEKLDQRVRVAIADRGKGIPKGQEDRIFERFYRIDPGRSRDQGGSGLGLAIVKSQVEAMGGRVWVEDNKPGAKFVVELDLA